MITYTDIFCGAGGSSVGLSAAGFQLKLAANHWARAIETHSSNFRDAEHLCADVSNYDMRRLPKTDILWASPICTELSPAGGNTQVRTDAQLDLLAEGPIDRDGFERTRATFHDVIRATEVHRYTAVLVENVVEVARKWELFDWWLDGMRQLDYQVQFVSVSAAHVGGEGNAHAPQWRDRLYLVFTKNGVRLPDVDPRPPAWCEACGKDVAALQSWTKTGRRIGKYRQQYWYVCPNVACRHSRVEPYVSPASSAIDWSDLGTRIGDRPRPLAAKTIARIEAGLAMFAQPITLEAAGNTFERRPGVRTWPAHDSPLTTLTTTATKAVACPPVMVSVNHDDLRAYPSHQAPLPSRTAKIGDGLVCPPFVTELRGGGSGSRRVSDPLATVTAGGNHHGLAVPPGSFYVKNYGGNARPGDMCRDVDQPLGTVTSKDHHALVIPFRRGAKPYPAGEQPLSTIATREQHALMAAGIDVADCSFRMLNPREHLRAQRFPDSYIVTGNKGEQTMQAGNAVSANVAQWLASRVALVLGGAA